MGHVDFKIVKEMGDAAIGDVEAPAVTGSTCAPVGRSALFAASATDAAARMFPEWLAESQRWPEDRHDARPEEKLPLGVRMLVMLGLAIAAWIPVFVLASLL